MSTAPDEGEPAWDPDPELAPIDATDSPGEPDPEELATTSEELERGPFLNGFFPIAADYQLPRSFERWKRRGINTVIRVPHGDGVGEWTREANRLGLKMIREPRSDIRDDVRERNLIAWSGQDEPDLHNTPASRVADFRARLRRADPDRPFFINFWGGAVLSSRDPYCNGPGDGSDTDCYPRYIDSADWVGGDIYPVNRYRGDLELVGRMIDKLQRWSGRRPVFAYIESSDWDGDGIGPSGRQVRAQIWHAIIHGARGILYFAVRLSPGGGCCSDYDATSNDVADTMRAQHRRIEELAPILQRRIDPPELGIGIDRPLEATWRLDADGTAYYVVLNFSNETRRDRRIRFRGATITRDVAVVGEGRTRPVRDGAITDDFDPYQVHVYRVR